MPALRVLVSVEHMDGVAAMVRTARGVWLAGYAGQPGTGTHVDDRRPAGERLPGDRTAHGGQLPPGAVGAEVVDYAGVRHAAVAANGAWVVVLDQPMIGHTHPVRYVDAAGATVPAPAPAGSRTPILDAPEPCPACDAIGWDQIAARDSSGGMAYIVCRTCGHAETAVTFQPPLREGDEPPWPAEENLPEGEPPLPPLDLDPGEWSRAQVARAGFPVYAVPGRPAEVQGSGSGIDGIDFLTLAHPDRPPVTVTTERAPHALEGEDWLARRALCDLDNEFGTFPERSYPAIAVWINAWERERRRVAATAELTAGELTLEGAPAPFAIATGEVGWAAVRRHADLRITVTARDCAPAEITLEPLV